MSSRCFSELKFNGQRRTIIKDSSSVVVLENVKVTPSGRTPRAGCSRLTSGLEQTPKPPETLPTVTRKAQIDVRTNARNVTTYLPYMS